VLDSVEFLDRPPIDGDPLQQWQVTWSEDNFTTPFFFQSPFTFDQDYLDESGVPGDLLDGLIGWRFNRVELPGADLSRANNLCSDKPVTFRIEGLDPGQFRVDNLAVNGTPRTTVSCHPELARLVGETQHWLDSLIRRSLAIGPSWRRPGSGRRFLALRFSATRF